MYSRMVQLAQMTWKLAHFSMKTNVWSKKLYQTKAHT